MNCQNCRNWAFGRCMVTNLLVGPDVLCNAWELSQSWEMVDMQFATFDAKELQKRIAELEELVDELIKAGQALMCVAQWSYTIVPELLEWNTLVEKIYKEREK